MRLPAAVHPQVKPHSRVERVKRGAPGPSRVRAGRAALRPPASQAPGPGRKRTPGAAPCRRKTRAGHRHLPPLRVQTPGPLGSPPRDPGTALLPALPRRGKGQPSVPRVRAAPGKPPSSGMYTLRAAPRHIPVPRRGQAPGPSGRMGPRRSRPRPASPTAGDPMSQARNRPPTAASRQSAAGRELARQGPRPPTALGRRSAAEVDRRHRRGGPLMHPKRPPAPGT